DRNPLPGMVLLARASDGGYDETLGFDGSIRRSVSPIVGVAMSGDNEREYADDRLSQQRRSVLLAQHLAHVAEHATQLCDAVDETNDREAIIRASRWHDIGKLHPVFQRSMYRCRSSVDSTLPLAKSDCPGPMRHSRRYFRHELASMLSWLA